MRSRMLGNRGQKHMAGNSAVFEPADKAVIASVLYRPGRAPEQVPLDRIDASAATSGGLLCVGLKDPEPALLEQIGRRLDFSRKAPDEIASPHRRPQIGSASCRERVCRA